MTANPLLNGQTARPGKVTLEDLYEMRDSLNARPWAIDYGWRWHIEYRNERAVLTRADNRGVAGPK